MVSNQEKLEFLQKVIDQMEQQENEQLIRETIHNLLMADTNTGKLYKYRAFNDYSFNNLKMQTLYGSKPSAFNDPFDSKIGVDIYSLVESKYNIEFDVIEKILNEFVQVYNGEKSIDICSENNKIIFRKLMRSKKFMDYLTYCYNNVSLSDEEINEHLKNNIDIIVEILSSILADKDTRGRLEYTEKMIPELTKIETMKTIEFGREAKSLKSIMGK